MSRAALLRLWLRLSLACCLALAMGGALAGPPERTPVLRCGWYDNPTPGNVWLTDKDGEWTISEQAGHEAAGNWPQFTRAQWVTTNNHYGHGCACLKVLANAQTREVSKILSARAVPLTQCRSDPALKEPH
jgi:hypothetical protein